VKPWLVGELNPYGDHPDMALYPLPRNASGGRLARIIGLSRSEYLRAFERMNLCAGRWSAKAAAKAAQDMFAKSFSAPVILLGAKVADAFRRAELLPANAQPFSTQYAWGRTLLLLPHPSGRNLIWNEPERVKLARFLVLDLIDRSK
jgi:hypothetical protein